MSHDNNACGHPFSAMITADYGDHLEQSQGHVDTWNELQVESGKMVGELMARAGYPEPETATVRSSFATMLASAPRQALFGLDYTGRTGVTIRVEICNLEFARRMDPEGFPS